jgi:hypothetical protein
MRIASCFSIDEGQFRSISMCRNMPRPRSRAAQEFRHFSFCDPSAAFSAGLSSEQNKEPKAMAHFTPVE